MSINKNKFNLFKARVIVFNVRLLQLSQVNAVNDKLVHIVTLKRFIQRSFARVAILAKQCHKHI